MLCHVCLLSRVVQVFPIHGSSSPKRPQQMCSMQPLWCSPLRASVSKKSKPRRGEQQSLDGVAGVLEAVELHLLHYRSPEQLNFLGTATQPAANPAFGLCALLWGRPVLHVHAESMLSSLCNIKSVVPTLTRSHHQDPAMCWEKKKHKKNSTP